MRIRQRELLSVALVCVALPALADDATERVFVLKNGRKILGRLVDESPSVFVIELKAGGRVRLARADVDKVETVAPKPRALEPEERKATPPPPVPREPSRAPAPVATPTAAAATPPKADAPVTVASLVKDGYRGASASELQECKQWLAEQAGLRLEQRTSPLARWGARTLVSVLVSVTDETDPARELALASALAHPADCKTEALQALIGTRGRTPGLGDVVAASFDAACEGAVDEALLLLAPADRERFVPLLEGRATHRSAKTLAQIVTKWSGCDPTAFGRILADVAARDPLPARTVEPLVAILDSDPDALAPDMRIEAALLPLRAAPRAGKDVLARIARRLAADLRSSAEAHEVPPTVLFQLQLCYETLAAMNDASALEIVETAVSEEADAARRQRWIRTLRKYAAGAEDAEFLRFLVTAWEKHDEDGRVVAEVLATVTGKSFSNARGQWRAYVDGLR